MTLRIAVVSPFLDRRHGTERALTEQIERLAHTYKCEVHVYAERVADLEVQCSNQKKPKNAGTIVWHRIPSFPAPHLLKFVCWMACNTIARRVSQRRGPRFDLVLSPGINCFDADVVIVHAVFHRLRDLSAQDESIVSIGGFARRVHRRLYYRLLTALERRTYSDPKVTLGAVSQRTSDLLAQYFHRKNVRVIPNGMDLAQFSPALRTQRRPQARGGRHFQNNDFVLLLIGNDWRIKGLPLILSAMAHCQDLPLRLLVVGEDAAAPFRQLANELGVADRCRWEAPRANVVELYAAADVYVSPSREDSFGLPVLEAMACGLPVITSTFAGISSLIRDGRDGFVLSDPVDCNALVNVLRRLHSDENLRGQIGAAAAESAKACTWDCSADTLWQFLNEVVQRRNLSNQKRKT